MQIDGIFSKKDRKMKMMKRLSVFLAALLLTEFLPAAESEKAFSARIFATKSVNVADQFAGILPNRPPVSTTVTKVVANEPFFVDVVFSGATVRNGSIALDAKITVTSPDGKKVTVPLAAKPLGNIRGDTSGVFLYPDQLEVTFEPDDPRGKHRFDLELTDKTSGRTARASTEVEYVAAAPQAQGKVLDKLTGSYYKSPCPECIVSGFREYLKLVPKQIEREKQNFNPLPQLAFFYFALELNPQCIREFAEMTAGLQNREERLFGEIVLNFLAKSPTPETLKRYPERCRMLREIVAAFPAAEREEIDRRMPENPFVIQKAQAPFHLDILWAEFLVRGTRAPVLKVAEAIALVNDAIPIDEFKKLGKPSQEDWRKLFNGLTAAAAKWSMGSLAKEHPLIAWYVEAALTRGEIADPVAAALAADAVGLEMKPGN